MCLLVFALFLACGHTPASTDLDILTLAKRYKREKHFRSSSRCSCCILGSQSLCGRRWSIFLHFSFRGSCISAMAVFIASSMFFVELVVVVSQLNFSTAVVCVY